MKNLVLGEGIAATGTVAQAAVDAKATPFLEGRDIVARLDLSGVTGTPTIKIQGSSDGTTWSDLVTHSVLYSKEYNIKCNRYMRVNQTAAGSAGTYSAYLTNGA